MLLREDVDAALLEAAGKEAPLPGEVGEGSLVPLVSSVVEDVAPVASGFDFSSRSNDLSCAASPLTVAATERRRTGGPGSMTMVVIQQPASLPLSRVMVAL